MKSKLCVYVDEMISNGVSVSVCIVEAIFICSVIIYFSATFDWKLFSENHYFSHNLSLRRKRARKGARQRSQRKIIIRVKFQNSNTKWACYSNVNFSTLHDNHWIGCALGNWMIDVIKWKPKKKSETNKWEREMGMAKSNIFVKIIVPSFRFKFSTA